MSEKHSILLIRLSAIGDVIHVLPALHVLRRTFPEATLGWLVEDRAAELLQGVKAIDRLHVSPRKRWRKEGFGWHGLNDIHGLKRELHEAKYDTVIDFQGLTKSGLYAVLSGAPRRIGFDGEDGRELNRWMTNERHIPASRHVIDRNLELASLAGAQIVNPGGGFTPEYGLPVYESARERMEHFWKESGLIDGPGVVMLCPGAGWETKRWPPEYLGRLGRILNEGWGLIPLVEWGPGEEAMASIVLQNAGPAAVMAPATGMQDIAELLRRCVLAVGGDTAHTHLAVALGLPVIAIYAAADPERNGPYGPGHLVLTKDLPCRPCWKTRCPLEHLACLRELTPDDVLPSVERFMESREFKSPSMEKST